MAAARGQVHAVAAGETLEIGPFGRLLLTHLWPGTDRVAVMTAAREQYQGDLGVATADVVLDVG